MHVGVANPYRFPSESSTVRLSLQGIYDAGGNPVAPLDEIEVEARDDPHNHIKEELASILAELQSPAVQDLHGILETIHKDVNTTASKVTNMERDSQIVQEMNNTLVALQKQVNEMSAQMDSLLEILGDRCTRR